MPIRSDEIMFVNDKLRQLGCSFKCGRKSKRAAVFYCECGNRCILRVDHVRTGHTQSCGCLPITHGHTRNGTISETYKTWEAMRSRCAAPVGTHHWKYYGAKGITICDRWQVFENFLQDMGERPAGYTIDRIKGHLGYSSDNCRWATKVVQSLNMSSVRMLTFDGKTMCLKDWARHTGIRYLTLWNRLNAGWSVAQALTQTPRDCGQRSSSRRS